jgi:hypothetical protein
VGRIYFAENMDKWRVCVNTVINLRGPQNMRTSLTRFSRTLLYEADSFSEYYSLRLVK